MYSLTIKDLENFSGIKAHTIRIWEQRYSFLKPKRTETNIRTYSCQELECILDISLLCKYGYRISLIDKMNHGEVKDKISSLADISAREESIVNDLIVFMVQADLERFECLLDEYACKMGNDQLVRKLIFSFLIRAGIFWPKNPFPPVRESAVSDILKRKLIVAIENVKAERQSDKTALLFLPEDEYRDLGLLFGHYLLKCRGIKIIYSGTNTSFRDIQFICRLKKPDYLFIHNPANSANGLFGKFLTQTHQLLPNALIVVSGPALQAQSRQIPPIVILKRSAPEMIEYIDSL